MLGRIDNPDRVAELQALAMSLKEIYREFGMEFPVITEVPHRHYPVILYIWSAGRG